MSDAKAVTEAAVYEMLSAEVEGAPVYQDVPQDEPYPLVIVGDMKSSPLGAKGDPDRRIDLVIIAMVAAEERAPLLALQQQIERILDGKRVEVDGWTLSITFQDDDAVLAANEDGAAYVGTSAFEILALTD